MLAATASGSGVPPLTADEKLTFAPLVDLGCPINAGHNGTNHDFGWYVDDVRPTLEVSLPQPGPNHLTLNTIRFSVADAYSGVDLTSVSLKSDVVIEGRPPGSELADMAQPAGEGIFAVELSTALREVDDARLYVEVADRQGNVTRVERRFSMHEDSAAATATPSPTSTIEPEITPTPTRVGTSTVPTPQKKQIYLPWVDQ